ncbi:hypothetical protein H8356DRAFT_1654155 [Neocallimastix lanati (nom. inval.)]|nr:hypothetical protein H8356DRAFT_1654155 [Neocallimastix sp. JGI-2020a]
MVSIHLRAETKKNEQRAALTPQYAKVLLDNGFDVSVERSDASIFDDSEYEKVGCKLVPAGSWRTAPKDTYIIGLKELPENDNSPLIHQHIMFAHCFKEQAGWRDVLGRFKRGNGTLLDLEFLKDKNGRRVAAFGYYAGFAGCAVGALTWSLQQLSNKKITKYPRINPYPNEDALVKDIKSKLDAAIKKVGRIPKVMVMGALGRCGTGACDMAKLLGIPESNILKWDRNETARGGPFKEILDVDIFINCIYLSKPIPPFLTKEMLDGERNLSVIVDVSCDATNPHNPIPVYNYCTTFDDPCIVLKTKNSRPCDIISIDHLPTLLPREASEQFVHDLLPSLLQLKAREEARVWTEAEKLYIHKVYSMGNASKL